MDSGSLYDGRASGNHDEVRHGYFMEPNKIRNLIKEAQRSMAIELYFSSENLTSLPPEITELKNLTELDILDKRVILRAKSQF